MILTEKKHKELILQGINCYIQIQLYQGNIPEKAIKLCEYIEKAIKHNLTISSNCVS